MPADQLPRFGQHADGTPAGGVLGHLCTCGHPDLWHAPPRRRCDDRGRCRSAGCACHAYSTWVQVPPVVHPAYDSTTGHRIDYVIPPGLTEHGLRSCACKGCRALYATYPRASADEPLALWEVAE